VIGSPGCGTVDETSGSHCRSPMGQQTAIGVCDFVTSMGSVKRPMGGVVFPVVCIRSDVWFSVKSTAWILAFDRPEGLVMCLPATGPGTTTVGSAGSGPPIPDLDNPCRPRSRPRRPKMGPTPVDARPAGTNVIPCCRREVHPLFASSAVAGPMGISALRGRRFNPGSARRGRWPPGECDQATFPQPAMFACCRAEGVECGARIVVWVDPAVTGGAGRPDTTGARADDQERTRALRAARWPHRPARPWRSG